MMRTLEIVRDHLSSSSPVLKLLPLVIFFFLSLPRSMDLLERKKTSFLWQLFRCTAKYNGCPNKHFGLISTFSLVRNIPLDFKNNFYLQG